MKKLSYYQVKSALNKGRCIRFGFLYYTLLDKKLVVSFLPYGLPELASTYKSIARFHRDTYGRIEVLNDSNTKV